MHKAYILFISVALVMMAACDLGANGKNEKAADSVAVNTTTQADKPDVSKTDSIELLQFPDPANQRKYNRVIIKDAAFIEQMTRYVMATEVQKVPCSNNYKMYLYKNGDVYKTIYAATADTCRYFAYVINGVTHFTGMSDSAVSTLKNYLH